MYWQYVLLTVVYSVTQHHVCCLPNQHHRVDHSTDILNSEYAKPSTLSTLLRIKQGLTNLANRGHFHSTKRAFEKLPLAIDHTKNAPLESKRVFQFYPFLSKAMLSDGPLTEFTTRIDTKAEIPKNNMVTPYIDHFTGMKSWGLPYFGKSQKDKLQGSSVDVKYLKEKPIPAHTRTFSHHITKEATMGQGRLDQQSPERRVTSILKEDRPKYLTHHLAQAISYPQEPEVNPRSQWIEPSYQEVPTTGQTPTVFGNAENPFFMDSAVTFDESAGNGWDDGLNAYDSRHDFEKDDGFMPFQNPNAGFGGFLDEQPSQFDGAAFRDFDTGEHNAEDPFPAAKSIHDQKSTLDVPQYIIQQSTGTFNFDTKDCSDIETKTCATSLDCSCYGLYKCTKNACNPLPAAVDDTHLEAPGTWHVADQQDDM